jgi:hypothetical protein
MHEAPEPDEHAMPHDHFGRAQARRDAPGHASRDAYRDAKQRILYENAYRAAYMESYEHAYRKAAAKLWKQNAQKTLLELQEELETLLKELFPEDGEDGSGNAEQESEHEAGGADELLARIEQTEGRITELTKHRPPKVEPLPPTLPVLGRGLGSSQGTRDGQRDGKAAGKAAGAQQAHGTDTSAKSETGSPAARIEEDAQSVAESPKNRKQKGAQPGNRPSRKKRASKPKPKNTRRGKGK